MARATIVHQFEDGSATRLEVSIKADGPDALDECGTQVLKLWRECMTSPEDAQP